jgi:hypothetical protein
VATAQIDRLVSGDLGEPDRRSLLAWLDEEPQRWRACALAFLEAQAWEQAAEGSGFGVQGSGARGQKTENREQKTGGPPLTTHHSPLTSRPLQWLAVAGLVLAAFAMGLVSGREWPAAGPVGPQIVQIGATSPDKPLWATVSMPTNLDPRLKAELTLPVAESGDELAPGSSIPEYVRQQWERKGFELTEEVRYLPARLPDGRQVMVPITKVHVKFKGTPVS